MSSSPAKQRRQQRNSKSCTSKTTPLPVGGKTGNRKGGENLAELYRVDTIELKKAMLDAGIDTILKLSEASGVNRNTCGDVVSGKSYPSSSVMQAFVKCLHLSGDRAKTIFFTHELA